MVPFILVSLVTLIFLIWAMRRCNARSEDYAMVEEQTARERYLEEQRRDSLRLDSIKQLEAARALAEQQAAAVLPSTPAQLEAAAREAAILRARTQPLPGDSVVYLPGGRPTRDPAPQLTKLYSTINGLNVRTKPSLQGRILARIPLYEEVSFMNEVTDSLYEIDLGEITPKEPWIKIRLKDGKVGWVYGAGVSYYKYELPGVIN